jgi:hypothetical protein
MTVNKKVSTKGFLIRLLAAAIACTLLTFTMAHCVNAAEPTTESIPAMNPDGTVHWSEEHTLSFGGFSLGWTSENTANIEPQGGSVVITDPNVSGYYGRAAVPSAVQDIVKTMNGRIIAPELPAEVRTRNTYFNKAALVRSMILIDNKDTTDFTATSLKRDQQLTVFCGWAEMQSMADYGAIVEGLSVAKLAQLQEAALMVVPTNSTYLTSVAMIRNRSNRDVDNAVGVDKASENVYDDCMKDPGRFGGLFSRE